MDRSSRPERLYRPTPAAIVEQVEALRRQRFAGQQIATNLAISPATVSRILRRLGLNRMRDLELLSRCVVTSENIPAGIVTSGKKRLPRCALPPAGFALPETDAELVVHLKIGPETDIVVADVDKAFALFLSAGGEGVHRPFDIAIGRCALFETRLATSSFC
jgi:hypothetical protein